MWNGCMWTLGGLFLLICCLFVGSLMRVHEVMIFGKVQWATTFLELVVVYASYLFSWYDKLFLNDAANMEILKLWVVRLSYHPWCMRGEFFQVAACVCGILSKMDSLSFQATACRCFSIENGVYMRTYAVLPIVDYA